MLEVKGGPRVMSMTYRITEFEPPIRVVLVGEGWGVWSEDRISFSALPTGTRVEYAVELRLSGILSLAQPLLPRYLAGLARGVKAGLQRELDARAEVGAGVGGPSSA